MTQDGKGLLSDNFTLQVIFTLPANSWCPARSFQTKTISSSCLGEYRFCYVLSNRRIHILIIISCVKTLLVPQNHHFAVYSSRFCIFSNHDLQLVANYVVHMDITFLFCKISLPKSSRYVLIDISNLTHFLCRNMFVMSYLIP